MRRFACAAVALLAWISGCAREVDGPIRVGSKNFTESIILGELIAQSLEDAGCRVERMLNIGGTFVADRAIRTGDLDVYPEYSGTALTAILDHQPLRDRDAVLRLIRSAYEAQDLVWGPELGFENTFAMIVRRSDAERFSLRTIGDLKSVEDLFQPGFGYEFVERQDGWQGLLDAYNLRFSKRPVTMDLGLTYRAVAEGKIDLIAGNSTDGLIERLDLVVLEDDLDYFPPYDAAIVQRRDLLQRCEAAPEALDALRNSIDEAAMRRMNFAVDGDRRSPAEVVREFRQSRGVNGER
jgi:glycine betaine/choline ABC-type transport system substrate-binding protein